MPSLLFFTHSEHGQAGLALSTATTLALNHKYDVHVASYEDLRDRVNSINDNLCSRTTKLAFHPLPGKSMKSAVSLLLPGVVNGMVRPPGLLGTVECVRIWMNISLGAGVTEYLQDYTAIQDLINSLRPRALIIDPLFLQAHDAARGMGLSYVTLDPTSAQMTVGPFSSKSFLSYPLCVSHPAGLGFRYPLGLWNRLQTYIFVVAALTFAWMPGANLSAILKAPKQAGIKHAVPGIPVYRPQDLYICPHVPETCFPEDMTLPKNVVGIPPARPLQLPLQQDDAALLQWLEQHPTILINFGSSDTSPDTSDVDAILRGIGHIEQTSDNLQVLWKTRYAWTRDSDLEARMLRLRQTGRLWVTGWLTVEPSVLMMTGHIVSSVHHGGANSFYEACRAGILQLILPLWADTFVFAERARYLGFGLIGNAGTAPRVDAVQFKTKLQQLLFDKSIQDKAAEIGRVCRRMGDGKELAAKAIVEWAENKAVSSSAEHTELRKP